MYHPATRLLTILELLQAAPLQRGPDLARALEVDTRTIRRYIQQLQDLGIPVEAIAGRAGGYRLRPGFKLPPLMLTNEETLAVTLGLLLADRLGLDGAIPGQAGAMAKIERVLPEVLQRRVRALHEAISLDLPSAHVVVRHAMVVTLAEATHSAQRIWLRYRDRNESSSERIVDPYGIAYHQGAWYLIGFCHLRQGQRIFRLDRIERVLPQEQHFAAPEGFDSQAALTAAIAAIPDRWQVVVEVQAAQEQIRRFIPATMAQISMGSTGMRLICEIDDLGMLARRLIAIDAPIVIIEPDALREAFRTLAHMALEIAATHVAGTASAEAPRP
ncbi:MAG: YafY family protein [Roseiflexaceae bacterium]